MYGETGAEPCPECGTPRLFTGQLICQGCFVPFALMPSAHAAESAPPPAETAETERLPGADRNSELTRVIHLIPGALPRPGRTRRDAPVRALRLSFPGEKIVAVEPGHRIRLGREPQLCPQVSFLARHDNLSRVHATVGVEADGTAWITDEGSTNGTYLRGIRLATYEPATLRPGDTFRLAADVNVSVLP